MTDSIQRAPAGRARWLCGLAAGLIALVGPAGAATNFTAPIAIDMTEAERGSAPGVALADQLEAFEAALGNGDQPSVFTHAETALALVEAWFGRSDARYAKALANLGIAQHAGDQIDEAARTTEQALAAIREAEGADSVAQVPVANVMTEIWFAQGELDAAEALQSEMFQLQRQQFGEDSLAFAEALETWALWSARNRAAERASSAYLRLIEVLRSHHGANDVRLIDPLLRFAFISRERRTGKFARLPNNNQLEADRAVNEAVRIAWRNAADNPGLLPRTLARKGDWLTYIYAERKSRNLYDEVWDLVADDPEMQEQLYGESTEIFVPHLPKIYSGSQDGTLDRSEFPDEGFVTVGFDVNQRGRAVNIRVVDGKPAGLIDGNAMFQIRNSLHRPAYENGKRVRRNGVTRRHVFYYNAERFTERERAYIERIASERGVTNGDGDG